MSKGSEQTEGGRPEGGDGNRDGQEDTLTVLSFWKTIRKTQYKTLFLVLCFSIVF